MSNRRQTFGKKSETAAARFLSRRGYKILERNYRTKLGEIDIIAKHKDAIVFIEVKARSSDQYGNPKSAISFGKRRKISMVAQLYLKATNQTRSKARFDVVTVRSTDGKDEIEIIKNAFELAY